MPTETLLLKVYNDYQLRLVENFLKPTFKGLKVKTEVYGVTQRGWVQIAISGEDENVALRYLAEEVGLCPMSLANIEKYSTIKGSITALGKSKDKLHVDIGISSPNIIDASIPLQILQAQLVDGRKIAFKKVVELFGFCENLPLTVKICNIDKEKNYVEATLSEEQLMQYRSWVKSLLDILIILGASLSEIKLALKLAKCSRDVLNIEFLGLFEHAVVCKFGTDAVGLIPKIGKNLQKASFSVFNPRKILSFTEECWIT